MGQILRGPSNAKREERLGRRFPTQCGTAIASGPPICCILPIPIIYLIPRSDPSGEDPELRKGHGPGWHTSRAPQGGPHHHHPRPGYPLQWPYPSRRPTQHEDREENTTCKEGQIKHHYEQPQRYNYHLNSGEDLGTHSEEQDRAPASVSPPIRIHRGPLPPNGSPFSHGIHIRSQSEQVLPGSGHTWFRKSLRCGFSSHPLPGPIQDGYCPRHMAWSEGHVRRPQRNSTLENTYSRKYTIGQGVGQGKILSLLLYKVYADNLLQKLEDSGLGVYVGTTFVGSPTCADDVLLVSPKAPDMKGMLNINQSYFEERRYSIHPIESEVSSRTGQDPNLMLGENKLPYTNAVTHLGLTRSLRNGFQIVQTRIDCARRSAYSLIPAGLHGKNGFPPTASKKLITTYILPRLLYGLQRPTAQHTVPERRSRHRGHISPHRPDPNGRGTSHPDLDPVRGHIKTPYKLSNQTISRTTTHIWTEKAHGLYTWRTLRQSMEWQKSS